MGGDRGDDAAEGEDAEGGGGGGEDDDSSDVEMEEVSGYHFMDCMPLFVSYVYVTSGTALSPRLCCVCSHTSFDNAVISNSLQGL